MTTTENMTTEQIREKVVEMIVEKLGKEESEIRDSSRYIEDLGADSLDLVEMMMTLEDHFGCEIPDDEAAKILTLSDTVKYIEKQIQGDSNNQSPTPQSN